MQPEIHGVRSSVLFLVLALATGSGVFFVSARRAGAPTRRLLPGLAVLVLAAVVGGKVYAILEQRGAPNASWLDLGSGLRYPGVIVAVVATLAWLGPWLGQGVSIAGLGDCLAPAAGFAAAVHRIGCLLNGCCFGTVSDAPWAIRFPRGSPAWIHHVSGKLIPATAVSSLPVHPLQLYLGLEVAIVGTFLLWFRRRQEYDGQLLLLFLALDGAGKFLLESVRYESMTDLRIAAALMATCATGVLVLRAARRRAAHEATLAGGPGRRGRAGAG